MTQTHLEDFDRDDGSEVTVEFTYTKGSPQTWVLLCEVEIIRVFNTEGSVNYTDKEHDDWALWLLENFTDDYEKDV